MLKKLKKSVTESPIFGSHTSEVEIPSSILQGSHIETSKELTKQSSRLREQWSKLQTDYTSLVNAYGREYAEKKTVWRVYHRANDALMAVVALGINFSYGDPAQTEELRKQSKRFATAVEWWWDKKG